jgi:Family of unknown function (DUF6308)
LIPGRAALIDADPEVVGGLYDKADHIYNHFWSSRASRVSTAKISKVLHLKYPALIPILDCRMVARYKTSAQEAAEKSDRWRRQVPRLYWEAVRQDLLDRTWRHSGVRSTTIRGSPYSSLSPTSAYSTRWPGAVEIG